MMVDDVGNVIIINDGTKIPHLLTLLREKLRLALQTCTTATRNKYKTRPCPRSQTN